MARLSRIVLALVVTLTLATTAVLAAPPAAARPRPGRVEVAASPDLFARLWSLLARVWSKNGCQVDPDGRCLTTTTGDNGCGLDPSGQCLSGTGSTPTGDNGCGIDPDGHCIH